MDADRKDLVHHLFALATEIAETAHEVAASGQASSMPAGDLIRAAEALDHHAGELQAIARAIAVAAGEHRPDSSSEKPS